MKQLKPVTLILFFVLGIIVQARSHQQGEILVKMRANACPEKLIQNKQTHRGRNTNLRSKAQISKTLNMHHLTFDPRKVDEDELLESLRNDPMVEAAQFNHRLQLRSTTPNDTLFSNQWQYINTGQSGGTAGADTDVDLVWDYTTGGLTADGDTIVVCVIDGGFEIDQPDLAPNIWRNKSEIPYNGIDDDNNGYVDDYWGWNTESNDDDVESGDDPLHGTAVAAIIGAVGNNTRGVAGINWNVKIMCVSGGTGIESEVLRAYSYALDARTKYNETNGAKGAFVVATNSSWGVDNGFAADAPLWCAMYNTMGEAGILSTAATANAAIDVETEGDLPTTCTSDYLIGVTNVTNKDVLDYQAAWGSSSIDIGAFGTNVYTIFPSPNYGQFDGTSAATPHVTGAIALLYSAPSPQFMNLVKTSPGTAAIKMKEYILNGGDANSSLQGITTTGSRLNIKNSYDLMVSSWEDCNSINPLHADSITGTSAKISWLHHYTDSLLDTLYWRLNGEEKWDTIINPSLPCYLDSLDWCSTYEIKLSATCKTDSSSFTESSSFTTDGCCKNPAFLEATKTSNDSISITWESILAAQYYQLKIKAVSDNEWATYNANTNSCVFDHLESCTDYAIILQVVCDTGIITPAIIDTIKTQGCGACLDNNYCKTTQNSSEEWISQVAFNTLNYSSPYITNNDDGYQDFTGVQSTEVEQGETYNFTITPDFSGNIYEDHLAIYIDYNANGNFDDNGEKVYSQTPFFEEASGTITIPNNTSLGSTRMRIIMNSRAVESSCELNGAYGETEDYCISILESPNLETPLNSVLKLPQVSPNPFTDIIRINTSTLDEQSLIDIELIDGMGRPVLSIYNTSISESWMELNTKHLPSGLYILLLKEKEQVFFKQSVIKQ